MPRRRLNVASGGRVRVQAERCATCIFRPGNRMNLRPGRLRELVEHARASDAAIPCHDTLERDEQAVCRGFYDLEPRTTPLQIAERLDRIDLVPAPPPSEASRSLIRGDGADATAADRRPRASVPAPARHP